MFNSLFDQRRFRLRSYKDENDTVDPPNECCAFAHADAYIKLGPFLGSGAFSQVCVVTEVDEVNNEFDREIVDGWTNFNMFIKMPKSHERRKYLWIEANVLQDLSQHIHIPQLYYPDDPIKILVVEIRCETSHLPCLLLRGVVGQTTDERKGDWESNDLEEIYRKVYDALQHAHSKGWAHLNVRPANIVTRIKLNDQSPGDCREVMLIDWACAQRNDKKVKGFIGSLPYAHDELFGPSKEWEPRLDHDLASLAYSLVRLSMGSIPWSGFPNDLLVTDDDMKERFEMACDHLQELFKTWTILPTAKTALLKAISHHEAMARKRKKAP